METCHTFPQAVPAFQYHGLEVFPSASSLERKTLGVEAALPEQTDS